MKSEKWRRKTLPSIRTPSSHPPDDESAAKEPDVMADGKKPRVFSKALRSLSNSSMESMVPVASKTSLSSRRLSKTNSSSASMMERIHRRVSKDSPINGSPPDFPASPMVQPDVPTEILQHGYLKADVTLLKARCEYLVLTDQSLIKFGGVEAARSAFPQLNLLGHAPNAIGPVSSTGGKQTAADHRLEIPLRSVVAAFNEEGSSPRFGIEAWWSSPWPKLAYCKTQFFFALPKERDNWLADIQRACRIRLRRSPANSIIPENLKARINHMVDTTEPPAMDGGSQNLTFPVAKRVVGSPQKSNAPEETQSVVDGSSFYLVIGPCMCYFIEVLKSDHTTLPGELRVKAQSFGTVTLTRFKASVASHEQRFVMSFRQPFNRESRLELASTHYRRIIESLTKVDRILKPMWPQHFQQAIFDIKGLPPPLQLTSGNDLGGLERSLQAYCAAFHVQVPRWTIEWNAPSQPEFRLLPPEGIMYTPLQLLAVFRALRYNSYFKALSFRNVDLSALAGKKDYTHYGDSVVFTSLNRSSIPDDLSDVLLQAPVLVQEFHALMFASESIKCIDLTNILGCRSIRSRQSRTSVDSSSAQKLSSEVLRPILALIRRQLCRCHSITMTGNFLASGDVEELANLLVLDNVRFRKLELANCGLGDVGLSKLWTGLAGQATSLEHLDTSENQGTVKFEIMRHSLSQLRAITKLNIAGNTRIGSHTSLFDQAAINSWALEELDVSGIALNDATVDVLGGYLSTNKSQNMRTIRFNSCGLTSRQVARLFREMGQARQMTLHLNANRLDEGIDDLCGAIACGYGPRGLFIQMLEFTHETNYIKLLRALTVNKTIECLSLAGSATPDPAGDIACQAVADFLAKNNTVRYLDISGYDAKLDEGRLGRGFSKALSGLRMNTRIEHLRVRSQMLNINIGDLAEAISANQTLHTLDCEGNDFNLSNFRHLIKHLEDNTSIQYFSAFSDRELSRTVQRSVDNVVSAAATNRRTSVMARFRHEKPQQVVERPLVQQLKEEWEGAVELVQRILDRNRAVSKSDQATRRDSSPHAAASPDAEAAFSGAFGGLALRTYEAQRTKHSSISNFPPGRSSTVSSTSEASRLQGRAMRSYSLASSEGGVSPMDGPSTGSAVPSPPELESPVDRESSLGNTQSPDTLQDDFREYSYVFANGQEIDFELEIKSNRPHWSDHAGSIEEEDARFHGE